MKDTTDLENKINLNKNKIDYYYSLLIHENMRNQLFEQSNLYKKDDLLSGHTILTEKIMSIKNVKSFKIGDVSIKKMSPLIESIYNIDFPKESSDHAVIFSPFYFEDAKKERLFSPIYFICNKSGDKISYTAQINETVNVFEPGVVENFISDKTGAYIAKDLTEIINIVKNLIGKDYLKALNNTKLTSKGFIKINFKNEFVFIIKEDEELDNPMLKGMLNFYKNELNGKQVVEGSVLDLILNKNHYGQVSNLYRLNEGETTNLTISKEKFIELNKNHLGSLSNDYPLAESQRFSLLATNSELKIVPVNGPPGTGKTALLKNIFANHMVKEVLNIKDKVLACNKDSIEIDYFKPILGTASVGQAIVNIIEGINGSFKDADVRRLIDFPPLDINNTKFNVNDYFVPLLSNSGQGIKDNKFLKISLQNIYNYILDLNVDEINKSYIKNYNSINETNHSDIYKITNELYKKIELNIGSISFQLKDLIIKSPSIKEDINNTNKGLDTINKEMVALNEEIKSLEENIPLLSDEYALLTTHKSFIETIRQLFTKKSVLLKQKELDVSVSKLAKSEEEIDISKKELISITFEIKNLNEKLAQALKDDELSFGDLIVTTELDKKERFLNFKNSFHILEAIFIHNFMKNSEHVPAGSSLVLCPACKGTMKETKETFRCSNIKGSKGCYFVVYKVAYSYNDKDKKDNPFSVNKEELGVFLRDGYLNKDSMSIKLNKNKNNKYGVKVDNKRFNPNGEFSLDNINLITPLFPLVVSTLHSLYSNFSNKDGKLEFEFFDLTLTDESGMILPSLAMPAAHITKKIVIVGDEKQIEPVFTVDNRAERLLFDKSFDTTIREIKARYEEPELIIEELYKSVSLFDNTFMSMANNATFIDHSLMGERERESKELWLREHFRCKDTIIKYCNYIIYKDILKPRVFDTRKQKNLPFYESDIFKDIDLINVDTIKNKNSSIVECNTIIDHISNNYDLLLSTYKGQSIESIVGIVTPYNNQAELIRKKLESDKRLENITVGTVHKFQGSERGVIYFSPVVCSVNDTNHFINRDSGNMMNVAVSRAKDSFIVVGSKSGMSKVGGYTEKFVKYIEEELYLKEVSEIV